MTAKGGLLEKSGHEFVIFDDVDIFLFQGSFASSNLQSEFGFARVIIVVMIDFFLGHGKDTAHNTLLSVTQLHARMLRNGK